MRLKFSLFYWIVGSRSVRFAGKGLINWLILLIITMKFLLPVLFVFFSLIYEISSGVYHGIRITNEETSNQVENLAPTVDIKQGTLEGKAELSRNGRLYLSFKGIPFGKVPQRFNVRNQKPQFLDAIPVDEWKGVKSAKEYGPKCAQFNSLKQFEGEEDCLTINVFVPKVESNSTETLPVMFWVYGGAFKSGESSIYQPKYFMDENVILVTVNYRVAAFGFLNAGIKGASGNQGLKDIVLGLRWVQDNIGVFGGNPGLVTIFGESAGAAAISHLVMSQMTKGLFSAAIAQSGAGALGWSFWPDPEFNEPKKLAQSVDCPTSNREYMVECLRNIRPEVLAKTTDWDLVWFDRQSKPIFAPSIETYKDNETNVFQAENVETELDKGNFNRVPLMIGFTSHEGLAFFAAPVLVNPNTTTRMNKEWGRVLPQTLAYWNYVRDPCVVSSKLRSAYFNGKPVGRDTADNLVDLYSHAFYQYPVRKVGLKHAKFAPVYFYNFTKESRISLTDIYGYQSSNASLKPATHADDLQYLFNGLSLWPEVKKDSPESPFSMNFVKLWASFAQNHKPTHIWGSKLQHAIEPIKPDSERVNWIQIDNELSVQPESDDFIKGMKVLDDICENDFNYCSSLHMQ